MNGNTGTMKNLGCQFNIHWKTNGLDYHFSKDEHNLVLLKNFLTETTKTSWIVNIRKEKAVVICSPYMVGVTGRTTFRKQ